MKEINFIEKNSPKWQKLEDYNKRLQRKNIHKLSQEEIKEFSELFRLIQHHLAYARTHYSNTSKTTQYLNQLVGVSHNFFTVKEKFSIQQIIYYFTTQFPQQFCQYFRYFLTALGIFVGGMIFAYLLTLINIEYTYFFLGGLSLEMDSFSQSLGTWDYPLISAAIMTNNIRVCFMSFVWGIFAGIGTIFILLFNGMLVGALAHYVAYTEGSMFYFWALILPHGFIELTAIFISGAAGLMIGKAILIPGQSTRIHALIREAKNAAVFIPGIVLMLVLAGAIEGFFTPLDIPAIFKYMFAFLTLIGMIVYFIRGQKPPILKKRRFFQF